jgi:putative lipoprotein (rSAM/lipoprotein system)
MFAFQACYGSPQDFGMDITIKGKVVSAATKASIPGIKVQVNPAGQYVQTTQDGDFSIYCERLPEYNLIISDMDGAQNGKYATCDTTVHLTEQAQTLTVNIELK